MVQPPPTEELMASQPHSVGSCSRIMHDDGRMLRSKLGQWQLLLVVILSIGVATYELDGEPLTKRAYYHFYANNIYDPDRQPFVVEELPFALTAADYADVALMVSETGKISSSTASSAESVAWLPEFIKAGTVNGTVAYSAYVGRDNPGGAAAMLRVRDRVVGQLAQHSIGGVGRSELHPVQDSVPWAAFSVTSAPSAAGSFRWHYDAESSAEYRALFVARGGDDCGAASVHYRDAGGAVRDIAIKTGKGYMVRGSQTFHAVYGGGCAGKPIRHMVGFQLSTIENRRPRPLCAMLLDAGARLSSIASALSGGFT